MALGLGVVVRHSSHIASFVCDGLYKPAVTSDATR